MSEMISPVNDNDMDGLYDSFFSFIPDIQKAETVPILYAEKLDQATFMKDWVSKNKPCLIKGAVKLWPAVNKWKEKSYWIAECENFEVRVFLHNNLLNENTQEGGKEDMLFHDAIERLFQNKDYILSMPSERIAADTGLSNIAKDIGHFNFLDPNLKPRVYWSDRVFMYRRAATSWHSHPYDETLMCQVNGSKKVVLFAPPKQHEKAISKFIRSEAYLNSKTLDPSIKIEPFTAIVEEGDALYIPPYCYHGVVPIDGNVGFTLAHCWGSPIYKLGDFSNYTVRNNYKRALWPIKKSSLKTPFFAAYAGLAYLINKVVA